MRQARAYRSPIRSESTIAVLRFSSTTALRAFLATSTMPARPGRLAALSDPALTGMSREDLAALTTRLALTQAAEAEQRKYLQRGGQRQPAARAGIFPRKITDAERVLATILGLRNNCSWDAVADLVQVSWRTDGEDPGGLRVQELSSAACSCPIRSAPSPRPTRPRPPTG